MRRHCSILLCLVLAASLFAAPVGAALAGGSAPTAADTAAATSVDTATATSAGTAAATSADVETTISADVAGTGTIDASCEYPLERTDARGETVALEDEPEEVVTLYPGDAQLAFQIGADDRVVGMPIGPYTDSLDVGDQTDISADDGTTPVVEEIVALDPDVVIAANIALADEDLLEQLESAGITVYVHDTATSIDDVRENVEATGEFTGECAGAQDSVAWMDDRLEIVADALEGEDEPLAYYVSDDEGTTPGTETFQHEVLESAGLENVAERADIDGWQEISAEVVVEEDPEWIVYPDWADEPQIAQSIETTTAYEDDNVVAVDDDAMSQPAPGIVSVVDHLLETVHPDVYDEIEGDLEAVDEEYAVEDGFGSDEGTDGDGDDETDTDGENGTDDSGDDGTDTSSDDTNDGATESDSDAESDDSEDETSGGTDEASGGDSIGGFGVVVALVAVIVVVARSTILSDRNQ